MDEHGTTADGVTRDGGGGAAADAAASHGAAGAGTAGAGTAGAPDATSAAEDGGLPPSVQALEEVVGLRGVDATQHAQELLAEHVPLALLVDLLTPTGDTSSDLLADEGLPEQEWWREGDAAPADATEPPAP